MISLRVFLYVFLLFSSLLSEAYAFTTSNQFGTERVEASPYGWNWYKVELHHHSAFSDGAGFCLGAVTMRYKELGYNATFLTDHDTYSSRTLTFDDSLSHLDRTEFADAGTIWHEKVDRLVTEPVKRGTHSLHLRLSASDGRGMVGYVGYLGPVLYAGNLVLNFSVYPTEFSGSSAGAFIGLWFGGHDVGVTLANGTWKRQSINIFFGLSHAHFGNYTSADTTTVNRAFLLPYTLNRWNSYSINITDYMVKTLPDILAPHVSMRRLDIGARTDCNQLVEVYFDDVVLYARQPKTVGELFSYRNKALLEFNTDTFKSFPSVEFSYFQHFNYFKYDFQSAEGYFTTRQIANDHKGVVDYAHRQGYLIMINHPTWTFNPVNPTGIIANNAFGADVIELASYAQLVQPAIEVWDALLKKGMIIIGVWATDRHAHIKSGDPATMIYSPGLTLERLLKSLFEGRAFMARNNFTGRLIYNIHPLLEPYPARYINYVSPNENATLYLKIDQGLQKGWKLAWIRNGTYFLNETVTDTSLEVIKSFNLPDNANYFRVEIRDETDAIVAMSQAIFFKKVSNMPTGMYVYLDDVITPDGQNYHNQEVKGITSIVFASQRLTAILYVPEGAAATMTIYSPFGAARQVFINGKPVSFSHATDITTISFESTRPDKIDIYYAQPKIVELTPREPNYTTNESVDLSLTVYGNYTISETIKWLFLCNIKDLTGTVVKTINQELQLSKDETAQLDYAIGRLEKGTYTVEATVVDPQNPKNVLATSQHAFEVTEVPIVPAQPEWTWYVLLLTTLIIGVTLYYCMKRMKRTL